ncbi:Uncharacterised protein [Mycobacteroides abscessus subsp. abscessus]|nr:Uncharacterised protein [Mycobacteroides abscessus subsp. abscessus]
MPSGEVNGVQASTRPTVPLAPTMTGAIAPATTRTPMIVTAILRARSPVRVEAHTRRAKTAHAVKNRVRANQPSPGSIAKAIDVLPEIESPSSRTTAATRRWMTTSVSMPVIRPEAAARGGIVAAMISVIRFRFSRRRF